MHFLNGIMLYKNAFLIRFCFTIGEIVGLCHSIMHHKKISAHLSTAIVSLKIISASIFYTLFTHTYDLDWK